MQLNTTLQGRLVRRPPPARRRIRIRCLSAACRCHTRNHTPTHCHTRAPGGNHSSPLCARAHYPAWSTSPPVGARNRRARLSAARRCSRRVHAKRRRLCWRVPRRRRRAWSCSYTRCHRPTALFAPLARALGAAPTCRHARRSASRSRSPRHRGGQRDVVAAIPCLQTRALQAKARCGGPDESGRVTASLRRLKGTPAQLREFLRDRNGAKTVEDVAALLAP